MPRIENLLVAMPLGIEHRTELALRLPNTKITYTEYMGASAEQVRDADVIFGNVNPDLLLEAPRLRWLQLSSAGTDGFLPVIGDRLLTNATGAYGPAISEHMLAMLLAMQKKLPQYHDNQKNSLWRKEGAVQSITGSVSLSVGLGDIGGEFSRKMKALGAYTIGVRRRDLTKPEYMDELHLMDTLPELLPRADVVALSLPNTPATVNVINTQTLSLMKPTAILINVGRGNAIDQDALVRALNSGAIGGACLDVTSPEPLPAEHPLWSAKNILITPHSSGGWTLPTTADLAYEIFSRNLDAYLDDWKLTNLVDRETGYALR